MGKGGWRLVPQSHHCPLQSGTTRVRLMVGTRSWWMAVLLEMFVELTILLASPPALLLGEGIVGTLIQCWMNWQLVNWAPEETRMPMVSTRQITARQVRTVWIHCNFGPVVIRKVHLLLQFL